MDPDVAVALLAEIDLCKHLLRPVVMPSAVMVQTFTSLNEMRDLVTEAARPGNRLATLEQSRDAIAKCKALLASAGDADPQMTIDFVGISAATEWAESEIAETFYTDWQHQ